MAASWINQRNEMVVGALYGRKDASQKKICSPTNTACPEEGIVYEDPIDGIPDPALRGVVHAFIEGDQYAPQTVIGMREIHLILAESALAGNDVPGFVTHVNHVRALDGLTPYDPGSHAIAPAEMLIHTRLVNLFLQPMRRLSDLPDSRAVAAIGRGTHGAGYRLPDQRRGTAGQLLLQRKLLVAAPAARLPAAVAPVALADGAAETHAGRSRRARHSGPLSCRRAARAAAGRLLWLRRNDAGTAGRRTAARTPVVDLENLGRSRSTVDGTYVRTDADRLVLAAWRADLPGTQLFRAAIDTLRIPREHVVALEQRRLSIGRTAALVAVGTGIVVLAVSELAGIGGNGDGGDGGTIFLAVPLRRPIGH